MAKKPIRIGSRPRRTHAAALQREMRAIAAAVRGAAQEIAARGTASAAQRNQVLAALRSQLRTRWSNAAISRLASKLGTAVESEVSRQWRPVTSRADSSRLDQRVPKYNGEKLLRGWVARTARLITSVRDEIIPSLEADLLEAVEKGTDPAELAARWAAKGIPVKWGTVEGRANVIAQTQLGQLNSEIQRARAKSVGVTEFTWHHSGNTRNPRPEHQARDGKVYEYDDPPPDGMPGTQPNCGCWAESIVTAEVLGALGIGAVIGGRAA